MPEDSSVELLRLIIPFEDQPQGQMPAKPLLYHWATLPTSLVILYGIILNVTGAPLGQMHQE